MSEFDTTLFSSLPAPWNIILTIAGYVISVVFGVILKKKDNKIKSAENVVRSIEAAKKAGLIVIDEKTASVLSAVQGRSGKEFVDGVQAKMKG